VKAKISLTLALVLTSINVFGFKGAEPHDKNLDNIVHNSDVYMRDAAKLDKIIKKFDKDLQYINKQRFMIEDLYYKTKAYDDAFVFDSDLGIIAAGPALRPAGLLDFKHRVKDFEGKMSRLSRALKATAIDSTSKIEKINIKLMNSLRTWQTRLARANKLSKEAGNTAVKINKCLFDKKSEINSVFLGSKAHNEKKLHNCYDSILSPPAAKVASAISKADKININITKKYNEIHEMLRDLDENFNFLLNYEVKLIRTINAIHSLNTGAHNMSNVLRKKLQYKPENKFGVNYFHRSIPLVSLIDKKLKSKVEKNIIKQTSGSRHFNKESMKEELRRLERIALKDYVNALRRLDYHEGTIGFSIDGNAADIPNLQLNQINGFFRKYEFKVSELHIEMKKLDVNFPRIDPNLCSQAKRKCK